jgi:hypothetical protein
VLRVHLAQHVVKRTTPAHNLRQKPQALRGRKRNIKAAVASSAGVELYQAPCASEGDGVVPRRHDHHHLPHFTDGGAKRMLPPLGRSIKRGVLACGEQVHPNDGVRLVRKESFERLDNIHKLVLPSMTDKPRRWLNSLVSFLPHLSTQRKLRGFSLGFYKHSFNDGCSQALKDTNPAVDVDELAKEMHG